MSLDATDMESESGPVAVPIKSHKVRLLTLSSLDKRTAAYRKAADLISSTESDLGGVETMTTAERQLVQRASLLGAWAESMETQWLSGETVDPALICTIGNAQRRIYETLGLRRRARDVSPSLGEYLAARQSESPSVSHRPSRTHERGRGERERGCRMKHSPMPIDEALLDKLLLGAGLGDPSSWSRWLAVLRGAFALPMSDTDRTTFVEVAGGREPPTNRVSELWAVLGRRSGKTRMAAAISVYIGAIEQHRLARGEVGYVLLLAASRDQARVAFEYVLGFLHASPILRQQVLSETAQEVRLRGDVIIGVHAGSFRTIRGRTLLAVVGDETSFWRDESSSQPDVEIYRACIPALAARRGLWVGISTGYRKTGLLYQKWRDHFGQPSDDILVIQGASDQFNATLDPAVITRAKASDPEAAESEWGGGFRSDICAFLDDEVVESCIDYGRPLELPPRPGIEYRGFIDVSGGRHDDFTMCIGHVEDGVFIADALRGRHPPFDPDAVTAEYAALLKDYRLSSAVGDAYSGAWAETAFAKEGITYKRSEMNKSQLYLEALPHFMRRVVRFPNILKLVRELKLLERRTSRIGKDTVDHGRNGSDDHANALVGCLQAAVKPKRPGFQWYVGSSGAKPGVFYDADGNSRSEPFQGEPMASVQDLRQNPWTTLR